MSGSEEMLILSNILLSSAAETLKDIEYLLLLIIIKCYFTKSNVALWWRGWVIWWPKVCKEKVMKTKGKVCWSDFVPWWRRCWFLLLMPSSSCYLLPLDSGVPPGGVRIGGALGRLRDPCVALFLYSWLPCSCWYHSHNVNTLLYFNFTFNSITELSYQSEETEEVRCEHMVYTCHCMRR